MQQLIGQSFTVGDGQYRVVDVRRLNGESLVYAEQTRAASAGTWSPSGVAAQPQRMAFHYSDIAGLFDDSNEKIA